MDFDEYDYLEKTVEDGADDRNGSASKKIKTNDGGAEKSDRSYRKREDDHNGDTVDADVDADAGRRSRRSRGDADDDLESGSGGRKRERGGEGRERSSRDDDRDRDRDRRNKERERRERHGDMDVEKGSRDNEKDLSDSREKNRESSRGLDREKDRDRDRERQSRAIDREKDRHRERESREKIREKDRNSERDKSEKDREIKEKDHETGREKSESSRERDRKRESRDKDRVPERGSREREREKEKERSRDRDRERERRDREKEKEESSRRSRSRSMSRRHEIDIDRDREIRDREREFEPREARRPRDKKETMEPEVDPERDQRTVFAYQMPLKANERDVYEFFTKAGKVRDVRLIMDRNSRRSKGVGYIEFYDAMSVPMAIALSGHLLHGQPVMVKPSEAEKNLVQSTASAGSTSGVTGPYGPVDRKLYVGNLHFNMTELQLRQIFEPFGTVELVQLPLDLETGHCKGFGFVQFALVEHAKAAQSLNGTLEIAGRVIKVSSVADHVGVQETGAKTADFDDDDGGGLSLNAHSRALLMQKLDRTGVASSITGSLGYPMLNGSAPTQQAMLPANGHTMVPGTAIPGQAFALHSSEPVGNPSECLLLKNMFDPATQTEPDFDLDIKEEVEDECSNFGRVKHIHLEKHSAGFVYLRFETVEAASKAQRAMHHRWYAGRLISALFTQPHEYEAKFKG